MTMIVIWSNTHYMAGSQLCDPLYLVTPMSMIQTCPYDTFAWELVGHHVSYGCTNLDLVCYDFGSA